jgi:hypothetical protein
LVVVIELAIENMRKIDNVFVIEYLKH